MDLSHIIANIFLCLSALVFLIGTVALFLRYHWMSKWRLRRGYIFAASLIGSVFLMEIAYVIGVGEGSLGEKTVEIFSTTLQFFSLDAGYTEIAAKAQTAFANAIGSGLFLALMSVFSLLAPIAGACFIGQLLFSFFPRLRLFFDLHKTKYVFSELNERSIVLAEDIARRSWLLRKQRGGAEGETDGLIDPNEEKWLKSACIVFTDAYSDDRSENNSELMMRAQRIGAICIKDDILEHPFHWLFRFSKRIIYFLIDSREESNVTTAISLLSAEKCKLWLPAAGRKVNGNPKAFARHAGGMELYAFVQKGESSALIHAAKASLLRTFENAPLFVKCVNEYRNVVYGMIDGSVLLDKLAAISAPGDERPDGEDLDRVWQGYFGKSALVRSAHTIRIVILGGGRIAKEYIKAAAWCYKMSAGQAPCTAEKVEILVYAQNAKQLEGELRVETNGMLGKDCSCEFIRADFPSRDFEEDFSKRMLSPDSLPAQRFLVAFGGDQINYEAALWIERKLTERYGNTEDVPPAIVDFAIEDDDLYDVLRERRSSVHSKWCILKPFSTMGQCFSYASVRMYGIELRAAEAHRIHDSANGADLLDGPSGRGQFFNDDDWQASVAVALHTPYKFFSRGYFEGHAKSLFDMVSHPSKDEEQEEARRQLYWLEHRRWLAYMRSCGFRCPSAKEFASMAFTPLAEAKDLYYVNRKHRDSFLRLHACILDSNENFPSIKELVTEFARMTVSDPQRFSAVAAIIGGGDYDAIRTALSAEIFPLRQAIYEMRRSTEDMELDVWLDRILLHGREDIDALDRLSLLITLLRKNTDGKDGGRSNYSEFKAWDFEISRGLYIQILRLRITSLCDRLQSANAGERANILPMLDTPMTELWKAKKKESPRMDVVKRAGELITLEAETQSIDAAGTEVIYKHTTDLLNETILLKRYKLSK